MAGSQKNVTVFLTIGGASVAKQDIEKVRNAFEGMGDTGKAAAAKIIPILEQLEKVHDQTFDKLAKGNTNVTKEGNKLLFLNQELKDAIAALGPEAKSIDGIEDAIKKANSQYDAATKKIADVKDLLGEQKEKLQEGGVAWTGIGDAMNKALGPMGAVQVQALAISAALQQGWQIGTQFAQAIGTDFEAAKSAVENLKTSAAGITNAFVTDGAKAGILQLVGSLKTLDDSVSGSGDVLKGFNAIVSAGVERAEALKVANEDLAQVTQIYTIAQQGGVDGLKLFNDTVKATDPAELVGKLEQLRSKFNELATVEKEAKAARDAHTEALKGTESAIQGVIAKLEAEKVARQQGLDQLNAEILERQNLKTALEKEIEIHELGKNVKDGLTESMKSEIEHISKLAQNYDDNTAAIKVYTDALKGDIELHKDAIPAAYEAQLNKLVEMIDSYGKAGGATKDMIAQKAKELLAVQQTTQIYKDASGAYTNIKADVEKATSSFAELEKANQKAGAAGAGSLDTLKETKAELEALNGTLKTTAERILAVGTATDATMKKVEQFGEVMKKVAGGPIDVNKFVSDKEPWEKMDQTK